jgi:hypothetical protein
MICLGSVLVVSLFLSSSGGADDKANSRTTSRLDSRGARGRLAPPGPWQNPPKRPAPVGTVIRVSTEAQLQQAVHHLRSNTTILLEPGRYELTQPVQIGGRLKNVEIRGMSNDRNQVVLKGRGMRRQDLGGIVPHCIMVNDATDVVIANLSVGDVWQHPITLQGPAGCKRVRISNVRLFDAGEQFLKSNPDNRGGGVDGCIVEYCVFEFTNTARHSYTQGMSVHTAANWIVRNNLFRNIRGPANDPNVGGCIDFWNGSKNTIVEGNIIVNCRMGIHFGLVNRKQMAGFHDHEGGVIRNNIFWRQPAAVASPDEAIMVWDSPNSKVLNNTVILNGTFPLGGIDYRWSSGVVLANNLTDLPIWRREESSAREAHNVVINDATIFADAVKGDLHLGPKSQTVLSRVPVLRDCPLDLDGRKRSEKTDVGADEFSDRREKAKAK